MKPLKVLLAVLFSLPADSHKNGLVGEENLEKFAKQFVAIQGGINAVSGGISVFFAMRDAVAAYRTSVLAASAANHLLSASQKGGVA